MKCCCKNPLTHEEKERLIKEAEKLRPLSESEKETLIRNAEAERARGVCHYHHGDMFKKLLLLFGILAALGLMYYMFMYRAKPHIPTASTMEQVEQQPSVVITSDEQGAISAPEAERIETKSEVEQIRTELPDNPSVPSVKNADKIMVEEIVKESAK
jgi:hypothetical protein